MHVLRMRPFAALALVAAFAAVSLTGSTAAAATGQAGARPAHQSDSAKCPASSELRNSLGKASSQITQADHKGAIETLTPLSSQNCDARVSLLLAAAFEAGGQGSEAQQTLERAHSVWPNNNSVAASLARQFMIVGQADKAAHALARFHPTATTPQQEMDEAVVVFIAAHQLIQAHAFAEIDFKMYPSVHTLIMLANTLQLEGRYPDVNRLLGDKRSTYSDSPEFFITLAESEFDAGIYDAARQDLERSIALNQNLYQAHYLLANTLVKLNDGERATAEYHRAIDLAPNQPRTYFQLAMLVRSRQEEAEEQRILEQALGADDHYAPAHAEMGRILLEAHHPAEALDHLTSAIQYNPRSEQAYFLLARAYAELGEKDKSNETVKRLVAVRKANRPDSGSKSTNRPDRDTP